MKELRQTGQFKRDLKRYQHSKDKLAKLVDVLELLRQRCLFLLHISLTF